MKWMRRAPWGSGEEEMQSKKQMKARGKAWVQPFHQPPRWIIQLWQRQKENSEFFSPCFLFFFFLTAVSVVGRQGSEKGILQRACDCCALSFAGKHRDEERCCVKTGALLMGWWVGGAGVWRRWGVRLLSWWMWLLLKSKIRWFTLGKKRTRTRNKKNECFCTCAVHLSLR